MKMPVPTISAATAELIADPEALRVKQKMMRGMRLNTLLNSASKVTTFIGAPLLAGGLGLGLKSYFGAIAANSGWLGAFAALEMPVVGTLVVGALFVAIAVGADYIASRMWQGNQFDNFELNAESTAHHLVKELQANSMCLTEEKNLTRADGKSWTQVVDAQRAHAQSQPTISA